MKSITNPYGKIRLTCFDVQLVPLDKVRPNNYNPNHVPEHYMEYLLESVINNGFCFPVVVIYDKDDEVYTIIDGEHRYILFKDYFKADVLPVVVLDHDVSQRMMATMQFNKARGVHSVEKEADMVKRLMDQGKDDAEIAEGLGMELETVQRLKQVIGIAAHFVNQNYSKAWEIVENG